MGCLDAEVVWLLSCVMIWFWTDITETYIPCRPSDFLTKSLESERIARACCCGMHRDARIEVGHVGVGEWTPNKPQEDNASGGN